MKDLNYLSRQWIRVKQFEDEAKEKRVEIESKIAELIPGPDEGSVSNGNVTVTRKLNYSFDPEQYEKHKETPGIPVRFKKEVDLRMLRAIHLAGTRELRDVCNAIISVKPAKPTITIEEEIEE